MLLRQEFAKILAVAYNIFDPAATTDFTDCIAGAWYIPYVGSLQKSGLAFGKGDGTYGINQNISRQDVATMMARGSAVQANLPTLEQARDILSVFADNNQIADYAAPAVAKYYQLGVISGYQDGGGAKTFKPRNDISRAEMCKILLSSLA